MICDYLIKGIIDRRLLRRATFYAWAIKAHVLTSITITTRLKLDQWQQALYQLVVYGYLLNCISFEYCEVLLYIISFDNMWMDGDKFNQVTRKSHQLEMEYKQIDSSDLYYNYYHVLISIMHRCNQDMTLVEGSLDENKDVVDVKEATTFMQNFAPDVVASRLSKGLYGVSAEEYLV